MIDLFGDVKRQKLDKDSESFVQLVLSLPGESVRSILETNWYSFGELQSRITVYGYGCVLAVYMCPAFVAHRVMCAL